jgi:UPF0755 protein
MTQSKNKVLLIISGLAAAVFFVALMAIGIWFGQNTLPADTTTTQKVSFVIPKGQSIRKIGERLQTEKLIRSELMFRFIVWREKLSSKIQAGSFELSSAMTPEEIAITFTKGTEDTWVTIPEGKRVEEVAEYFTDFPDFDKAEFIKLSKKDEGYLFPDTYLIPTQATAKSVHDLLRKNFDQVAKKINLEGKAPSVDRSPEEIVTLASILEREARGEADMKVVAGILYNRLDQGIALQVDATMQYAKGYDTVKKQWWTPPLAADKDSTSPYNTYKFSGLPPGPICNPGEKALNAALNPTKSDYLFYITDNDGLMHYSKTYDEHLQNVQKYLR